MANKITEKELQKAIDNCFWRTDIDGVFFCKGMLLPCLLVIERGQCDTIKELISEKAKSEVTIKIKGLNDKHEL